MNSKGVGPTLTMLIIGLAIFIATVTLYMNVYVDFTADNGGSIDADWLNNYYNINNSRDSLNTVKTGLTDIDLVTTVQNVASTSLNGFLIGLGAIGNFFALIVIVPSIFNDIASALHLPEPVIWLFIFGVTIYIAMKLVKASRGTSEEA